MNRLVLGVLLGVAFGVIDVMMTLFGKHPDRTFARLPGCDLPPHSDWPSALCTRCGVVCRQHLLEHGVHRSGPNQFCDCAPVSSVFCERDVRLSEASAFDLVVARKADSSLGCTSLGMTLIVISQEPGRAEFAFETLRFFLEKGPQPRPDRVSGSFQKRETLRYPLRAVLPASLEYDEEDSR